MRSRLARLMMPAVVLTSAALTMAACSSGGGSSTTAGATPSTQPTPASTSPAAPGTSSAGAATGSGSGSSSSKPAPTTHPAQPVTQGGGTPACSSSQLTAALTNSGVGAGQYYADLVFTNTSATTCTLTGYPGVSYVTANGVQSGNPAARSAGNPQTVVTLKPHGTATAQLHDSNGISGYSPSQCDLSPADGLRVYPPGQTAALFVPWKTQHCAGLSITPLNIGPVQ
ncbi:hypothetical protein P3T37_001856 [Kitasatospora sp. MAA4]|uniref:DUF4232 domain-containing protein n=1 Tax=Kitasatospora sp. MAA4 TaxID=3035093 RepID=UPI0024754081|nr:DUF4232 domain-containing protein [Kitasatospora sp. MAA4]MDH6132471.1 hypothetical protein [Kitasatospora sp. MAA4]